MATRMVATVGVGGGGDDGAAAADATPVAALWGAVGTATGPAEGTEAGAAITNGGVGVATRTAPFKLSGLGEAAGTASAVDRVKSLSNDMAEAATAI